MHERAAAVGVQRRVPVHFVRASAAEPGQVPCSWTEGGSGAAAARGGAAAGDKAAARALLLLKLKVRDEAERWGPPGSERSCGTQLSERESERRSRVGVALSFFNVPPC